MKKLKVKIDKAAFDALDATFQEFYILVNEDYILQIEGVADHPDAKNLKTALDKERTAKKTAEDKADALETKFAGLPEDFSVESYNKLLDTSGGKNIEERLVEQRERLTKEFTTKETALKTQLETATKRGDKFHADAALMKSLNAAGITDEAYSEAAIAMFKDKVKVSYEGDEAIVTIDNVKIDDAIKDFAGTDKGKKFVSADGNHGGGGDGGKGKKTGTSENPWDYDNFNMTKQTEIQMSDPTRAESLKKSAKQKPQK